MLLSTVVLALLGVGCSSYPAAPEFEVASGGYPAVFDAAREVLRDHRFQLERVDAAAGVITTQPKSTGGYATPWDDEQSTAYQNLEDAINLQRRIVRITFTDGPEARGQDTDVNPAAALRARVEVTVYRMQTPGLRPSSRAITMTSVTTDPAAAAQGTGYSYEVPLSQDTQFAARLAEEITRRAAQARTPHAR